MKKIYAIVLATLLVFSFTLFASSANYDCETSISGDPVVKEGYEYTYDFTVSKINIECGIVGGFFEFVYDPDYFELVNVSSDKIDHWQMDEEHLTPGQIVFNPADSDGMSDNAVSIREGEKIKYSVSLKVKKSDKKETVIQIRDSQVQSAENGVYKYDYLISNATLIVKTAQILSTPNPISFDGGVAKWSSVENADEYIIQLYKNSVEYGSAYTEKGATEKDYSATMTESGKYSFTVVAHSNNEVFKDSEPSAQSPEYKVVGDLTTPTIVLSTDSENGGLTYKINDTNPSGSVKEYKVEILDADSTVITSFNTDKISGNIPEDKTIVGGLPYSATVQAISSDEEIYHSSVVSAASLSAISGKKIDSIAIIDLPTLSYVDGQKLDLKSMTVEIKYADGSKTETPIKYADFAKSGITCNFQDGKKLTLSDNGALITVTAGGKSSSQKITVTSSVCEHKTTHKDTQKPTCGEAGCEKVICDNCGATISSTVLDATGEHVFGQWETVVQPTSTINGQRQHVCGVCGKVETETIPPLGPSSETTESGNNTEPRTTTEHGGIITEDTDKPSERSSINDLSKIFMIIVIVIFCLIILFIILGIALENRRANARRKKRKKKKKSSARR